MGTGGGFGKAPSSPLCPDVNEAVVAKALAAIMQP